MYLNKMNVILIAIATNNNFYVPSFSSHKIFLGGADGRGSVVFCERIPPMAIVFPFLFISFCNDSNYNLPIAARTLSYAHTHAH